MSASSWFPTGQANWRLDVVSLLAVIGEGSVGEHAQAITASFLCLLPRIVPAPHTLLRATRPARMPEVTAKTAGVYSGVVLDTVGFFANIIQPLDQLQPFGFKVLHIKHSDENEAAGVVAQAAPASEGFFAASRSWFARNNIEEKVTDYLANPTMVSNAERPAIPAALHSPVHVLSFFSFLLTVALFVCGVCWKDGTAILALVLVSLACSIFGYANWWKPVLMRRPHTNKVPPGDMVIRTREGAFLLVRCTEEVARELFSGTEECFYHVKDPTYKALMGLGTVLLMIAVVLLGNCGFRMQIAITGSYVLLNGLYWAVGLLPKKYFWDLGRYDVVDKTPDYARNAHTTTDPDDLREGAKSFTRTLWYVIRETRRIGWVERSGAAPGTPQWRTWLREAEAASKHGNLHWPAVARKNEIMKEVDEDEDSSHERDEREQRDKPRRWQRSHAAHDGECDGAADEAAQHAPAQEVQPQG